MAFIRRTKPSLMSSIGEKVKQGTQVIASLKGAYDIGKTIYSGIQTVAPIIAGLL